MLAHAHARSNRPFAARTVAPARKRTRPSLMARLLHRTRRVARPRHPSRRRRSARRDADERPGHPRRRRQRDRQRRRARCESQRHDGPLRRRHDDRRGDGRARQVAAGPGRRRVGAAALAFPHRRGPTRTGKCQAGASGPARPTSLAGPVGRMGGAMGALAWTVRDVCASVGRHGLPEADGTDR